MPVSDKLRLSGIVPPMVTPLNHRDELNVEGTERLVERLIDGGVAGIFVLGTTGEAPCLGFELRSQFISVVCRQVGGRCAPKHRAGAGQWHRDQSWHRN